MMKGFLSKLSAEKQCKITLIAALSIVLLAGCAAPKVKQAGPVFFPPPPNPPRLQFLTAISGSADIEEKKDTFSLFIAGKPEEDKNIEILKPYGVTVHKKKIYVCDLAGRIAVIDPAKKTFEFFRGNGYGGLKKPINLTFDEAGNMYVTDMERKEILVFDPSGVFIQAIGKEYGMKPTDVIVDADFVYVLDYAANEIKLFDKKDGKLVRSIGKSETSQSLALPTNFTLDNQNAFRVTNIGIAKVTQLDKDGHLLGSFGKQGDGFGDFARPKGIAADPEGRIYVVDAGHQNVQIFNETGRLLMFFGGFGTTPGSMNLPTGISVVKADIDFFQQFADPSFELQYLVFVTNQYGNAKLSVYGLGKRKGEIDKPAESGKKPSGEQKKSEGNSGGKSEK